MPNISGAGDKKSSCTLDGGEAVVMSPRYIQQYLSQSIHMPYDPAIQYSEIP